MKSLIVLFMFAAVGHADQPAVYVTNQKSEGAYCYSCKVAALEKEIIELKKLVIAVSEAPKPVAPLKVTSAVQAAPSGEQSEMQTLLLLLALSKLMQQQQPFMTGANGIQGFGSTQSLSGYGANAGFGSNANFGFSGMQQQSLQPPFFAQSSPPPIYNAITNYGLGGSNLSPASRTGSAAPALVSYYH